jgi:hypothetical protein
MALSAFWHGIEGGLFVSFLGGFVFVQLEKFAEERIDWRPPRFVRVMYAMLCTHWLALPFMMRRDLGTVWAVWKGSYFGGALIMGGMGLAGLIVGRRKTKDN